jgi:hypothetical protein
VRVAGVRAVHRRDSPPFAARSSSADGATTCYHRHRRGPQKDANTTVASSVKFLQRRQSDKAFARGREGGCRLDKLVFNGSSRGEVGDGEAPIGPTAGVVSEWVLALAV